MGTMAPGPGEEERTWTADKRDFVAEWRDATAGARDATADDRERIADAREVELDEWERRLEERAAELALTSDAASAQSRADGRTAREQLRAERSAAAVAREAATARREDVAGRRLAIARPTLLAMAFASIAEELYNADNVDDVLLRIAEVAVSTVTGCGMASVTLLGPDGTRTAASTAPAALAVDAAQNAAGEGPSFEALTRSMVHADAFPDERWPALGARPTESGVHSVVSYHLAAPFGQSDAGGAALNAYGHTRAAFDQAAREIGLVLAAHASMAVRAVGERTALLEAGTGLHAALMSRDVIGQAKGILMERLRITPEDAFDVLRRSSQSLNLKLREVARRLSETGQFPKAD